MTNQNAKKQDGDWFSGLAYDLKTGGSQLRYKYTCLKLDTETQTQSIL